MDKKDPKLVIGFIIFGKDTAKYLPYFLPSLRSQSYQDIKVLAFDSLNMRPNKPYLPVKDDSSGEYIRNHYPNIQIVDSLKNTGFARSHNKLIDRAVKMGAKYYLVVNSDVVLEPDALEKLVKALDDDEDLAAVCPKILKWDFDNNNKTDVIDSCGIGMRAGLRFYDIGQGQDDGRGLKGDPIGPSGACGLYRISVLKKIAEDGRYFDENMFMYKEDCDLAYRLYIAGYRSKCISKVRIYHDRTASAGRGMLGIIKGRGKKSKQVKAWSFRNQLMIFYKYWHKQDLRSKMLICLFLKISLLYCLIFERFLLKEFLTINKIKANIRIYR